MSVIIVPVNQRPLRYRPACEARRPENRQLVSVRPGQSGRPRQKACGSAGNSKKVGQARTARGRSYLAGGASVVTTRGSVKGPQ